MCPEGEERECGMGHQRPMTGLGNRKQLSEGSRKNSKTRIGSVKISLNVHFKVFSDVV